MVFSAPVSSQYFKCGELPEQLRLRNGVFGTDDAWRSPAYIHLGHSGSVQRDERYRDRQHSDPGDDAPISGILFDADWRNCGAGLTGKIAVTRQNGARRTRACSHYVE